MKKWLLFIPVIFLSLSFVDDGRCGFGYEMNWDLGDCVDVDECRHSNACPVDYECENTLGGFMCHGSDGKSFVYGGGPSGFDPTKYNINTREAWGIRVLEPEWSVGTWVTLPNGQRIKLSVGIHGKMSIRYPFCKESPQNLCIKTHIDKPIEYL